MGCEEDLPMVFLHDFHTWFWMRWFSVHGFGHGGLSIHVIGCFDMYKYVL